MNVFEAAVVIITVITIASVFKSKHRTQAHHHSTKPSREEPDNTVDVEQMQQQILDLKNRVETLEAIVTDKSYNLKRDIDNL